MQVARYGQAFEDKAVARMLLSKSTPAEEVAREVVISVSVLKRSHGDLSRTQGTNHSNRGQPLFPRSSLPPRRRRSSLIERKISVQRHIILCAVRHKIMCIRTDVPAR